jgi:hypothetical protein
LAYFHYCNKGVFPFSEDCKDQDLRNLAELDDTAVQFVRYTRKYALEHSEWILSPSPRPLAVCMCTMRGDEGALTGILRLAENQWQELWDGKEYENDYYFVSQLFEQNWHPRSMT